MKQHFRKTWRHEVIIEAETAEEAKSIWEMIDLGNLDMAVTNGEIVSHEFVQNISFEDQDYNEIP